MSVVSLLQHQRKLIADHHTITKNQVVYYEEKLSNLKYQCNQLLLMARINEIDLSDYENTCKLADEHLFLIASKLKQKGKLKDTDIQICILVLIGLNRPQIAEKMRYSASSIGKLKDIVAKSLGTTSKDLRDYLMCLAIDKIV